MKHKVSELEGALLDAAVALAEFGPPDQRFVTGSGGTPPVGVMTFASHPVDVLNSLVPDADPVRLAELRAICDAPWSPSTNWRDGGPLIESERIELAFFPQAIIDAQEAGDPEEGWCSTVCDEDGNEIGHGFGETALIAAMRAYVASKFGDEVDL